MTRRVPATSPEPADHPAEPFVHRPFELQSCTTPCPITPEEQAAYTAYYRSCASVEAFWAGAPASDWMLDILRKIWDRLPASIEFGLRRFALGCVEGLSSANAEPVQALLDVVRRRLDGAATVADLRATRAETHGAVAAGGVHGLPRCRADVAALLAAWHAANPDAGAAAAWSAEFAARHDAWLALREPAAGWHWAEDRGEHWRDAWRVAFFARARPAIEAAAMADARRRQAELLRSILPSPYGPPVRGEVYFGPKDDDGSVPVYCVTCGAQRGDTEPGVLFDVRWMLCSGCGAPVARCVH